MLEGCLEALHLRFLKCKNIAQAFPKLDLSTIVGTNDEGEEATEEADEVGADLVNTKEIPMELTIEVEVAIKETIAEVIVDAEARGHDQQGNRSF